MPFQICLFGLGGLPVCTLQTYILSRVDENGSVSSHATAGGPVARARKHVVEVATVTSGSKVNHTQKVNRGMIDAKCHSGAKNEERNRIIVRWRKLRTFRSNIFLILSTYLP